jgi:hypothetical protein
MIDRFTDWLRRRWPPVSAGGLAALRQAQTITLQMAAWGRRTWPGVRAAAIDLRGHVQVTSTRFATWVKSKRTVASGWAIRTPSPALTAKLSEWFWRYLPLEIISTITAVLGAYGAALFTDNRVVIAFAATWIENVGYYAYAIYREHKPDIPAARTARNLLVEFGIPEVMDSFIVRPFCMYVGTQWIGNLGLGIAAGKIAADVVFYALVIVFYEARKKYFD